MAPLGFSTIIHLPVKDVVFRLHPSNVVSGRVFVYHEAESDFVHAHRPVFDHPRNKITVRYASSVEPLFASRC